MKTKTLFIILSFTYSFISYAQKTLDTEIILTSNDTLRTKIRVYATVIDNGFLIMSLISINPFVFWTEMGINIK